MINQDSVSRTFKDRSDEAAAAIRGGDNQTARQILEKMLQEWPQNEWCLKQRSGVCFHLNLHDQSIEVATRCLEVNPRNVLAMSFAASSLAAKGSFSEGAELARRAIAIDPECWYAWTTLSRALFGLRQYTEALEALDFVAARNPSYPGVFERKAYVLHCLGRSDEALTLYRTAVGPDPDQPEKLTLLAELTRGSIRPSTNAKRRNALLTEAERYTSKVYQLAPEQPDAVYNYVSILSKLRRYESVIAVVKRFLESCPPTAELLLAVGHSELNAGRPREAIPYLVQSFEADPKNPVARGSLARAYWKTGRPLSAVQTLLLSQRARS